MTLSQYFRTGNVNTLTSGQSMIGRYVCMMESTSDLLLLLLILLGASLSEALTSCTKLRCNTPCSKENHKIYAEGKEVSCDIQSIQASPVPWPQKNDTTSPAPENLQIRWYTHKEYNNKDSKVALDIRWKAKANSILKGSTEGFFLIIDGMRYQLNFHIQDTKYDNSSLVETAENLMCMKFRYYCYGRKLQDIRLDYTVRVKIHALPMWKKQYKPKQLRKSVHIPRCMDDKRLAITKFADDVCKYYWKTKEESGIKITERRQAPSTLHLTTTSTTPREEKPIHLKFESFLIFVVVVVLVGWLLIIAMVLCSDKWNKLHSNEQVPVLMIASDLNDNQEKGKAQIIHNKLTDNGNLTIKCDWHNTEDIRKNQREWYQCEIDKAEYIMLMVKGSPEPNELGSENRAGTQKKDSFINLMLNWAKNKKVIFLTTDDNAKRETQRKWRSSTIYNCNKELDLLKKQLFKSCYQKKEGKVSGHDTGKQTDWRGGEDESLLSTRSTDSSILKNIERHKQNGAIPKTNIIR